MSLSLRHKSRLRHINWALTKAEKPSDQKEMKQINLASAAVKRLNIKLRVNFAFLSVQQVDIIYNALSEKKHSNLFVHWWSLRAANRDFQLKID